LPASQIWRSLAYPAAQKMRDRLALRGVFGMGVTAVDQAIAQLEATGRLDAIYEEWIVSDQAIPYFEQ
jgi:hypothetical protein